MVAIREILHERWEFDYAPNAEVTPAVIIRFCDPVCLYIYQNSGFRRLPRANCGYRQEMEVGLLSMSRTGTIPESEEQHSLVNYDDMDIKNTSNVVVHKHHER